MCHAACVVSGDATACGSEQIAVFMDEERSPWMKSIGPQPVDCLSVAGLSRLLRLTMPFASRTGDGVGGGAGRHEQDGEEVDAHPQP